MWLINVFTKTLILPGNEVGSLTVENLPRKVHMGPGSWSLLLFCLNWLGMSKDKSEQRDRNRLNKPFLTIQALYDVVFYSFVTFEIQYLP